MPQGKLYVRAIARSGTINCLVVPEENRQDWFFVQFPVREALDEYAKEYDLEVIETQEEDDGTDS